MLSYISFERFNKTVIFINEDFKTYTMKKEGTIIGFLVVVLFLLGCVPIEQKQDVTLQKTKQGASVEDEEAAVSSDFYMVVVGDEQFMPASLVITIGDTVQWVNKDNQSHTVTFENKDIDELLPPGGSFEYTFDEKGQFSYVSVLGPGAQGVVVVR